MIGYTRTSTAEQVAGFDAQKRDLEKVGCEEVFCEQVSCVAPRKELDAALKCVRKGDQLVVTKLDRLARSTQHLLKIVELLEEKSVARRIPGFGGLRWTPNPPAASSC
jgi:DNA invertase Pin-like site-specific DNA recombinase